MLIHFLPYTDTYNYRSVLSLMVKITETSYALFQIFSELAKGLDQLYFLLLPLIVLYIAIKEKDHQGTC